MHSCDTLGFWDAWNYCYMPSKNLFVFRTSMKCWEVVYNTLFTFFVVWKLPLDTFKCFDVLWTLKDPSGLSQLLTRALMSLFRSSARSFRNFAIRIFSLSLSLSLLLYSLASVETCLASLSFLCIFLRPFFGLIVILWQLQENLLLFQLLFSAFCFLYLFLGCLKRENVESFGKLGLDFWMHNERIMRRCFSRWDSRWFIGILRDSSEVAHKWHSCFEEDQISFWLVSWRFLNDRPIVIMLDLDESEMKKFLPSEKLFLLCMRNWILS